MWYLRKHWPALAVMVLFVLRIHDGDRDWPAFAGLTLALSGTTLNLFVILVNGGRMPARKTEDEDLQPDGYCDLDSQTRLPWLADWIDVGPAWISPGDILINIACGCLLWRIVFG